MIRVTGLTKYYGKTKAIENVSFSIEKGEIVGLLGPNAAGKTTIMRILTCFLTPTSGTAIVNNFDIWENPEGVQKSIGYLPERNPLYEELTVEEFLNFVAEIKGIRKKREKIQRISDVMEKCGLLNVEKKSIWKLSKGYRQRVGIAQALINNPPVLILDEPTIGLDPKQIIETRKLIGELAGERTIILSTHILPEVSMTCERVIIINEGNIVTTDTVENLTARLKGGMEIILEVEGEKEKVKECIKSVEGIEEIEFLQGRENINRFTVRTRKDIDIRKELSAKIVNSGLGLLEISIKEMSLEDVFVKLTTEE